MPKLKGSSRNCNESQIVIFLGPLDITDGIGSSRDGYNSLFLVDIVDTHVVIIALINTSNISAAWTDSKSSYSFGRAAKTKLTDGLTCLSIPNVDG
jgi:hypothetical protein